MLRRSAEGSGSGPPTKKRRKRQQQHKARAKSTRALLKSQREKEEKEDDEGLGAEPEAIETEAADPAVEQDPKKTLEEQGLVQEPEGAVGGEWLEEVAEMAPLDEPDLEAKPPIQPVLYEILPDSTGGSLFEKNRPGKEFSFNKDSGSGQK